MIIRMVDEIKNIEKLVNVGDYLRNVDDIQRWLDILQIDHYIINDDYSVDVKGDVTLYDKGLTCIPVKFGTIKGSFNIGGNFIKSLHNCPQRIIGGNFYTHNSMLLTCLLGGPVYVDGDYIATQNPLFLSLLGLAPTITGKLQLAGSTVKYTLQGLIGSEDIYNISEFETSKHKYDIKKPNNIIDNISNLDQFKGIKFYEDKYSRYTVQMLPLDIIKESHFRNRLDIILRDNYKEELIQSEYLWCINMPMVFNGMYPESTLEKRKDELIAILIEECYKRNITLDFLSEDVNTIASIAVSGNHKLR